MRFTTAILALAFALTASPAVVTAQPDSDAPFPALMIPVHPGYYMGAETSAKVYACPPANGSTVPNKKDCPALGVVRQGASVKVADVPTFSKVVNEGTPDQVEWVRVEYRQDLRKQGGKWQKEAWIPRYKPESSGERYSCKEGEEDMWGIVCTAEEAAKKLPLKIFTATDDMSDGEAWRSIKIVTKTPLPLRKTPNGEPTAWTTKERDHLVVVQRDPRVGDDGRTWWLVAREVSGEVQLGWIPDQLRAGSMWPTLRDSKRETEYFDIPYQRLEEMVKAADARRR